MLLKPQSDVCHPGARPGSQAAQGGSDRPSLHERVRGGGKRGRGSGNNTTVVTAVHVVEGTGLPVMPRLGFVVRMHDSYPSKREVMKLFRHEVAAPEAKWKASRAHRSRAPAGFAIRFGTACRRWSKEGNDFGATVCDPDPADPVAQSLGGSGRSRNQQLGSPLRGPVQVAAHGISEAAFDSGGFSRSDSAIPFDGVQPPHCSVHTEFVLQEGVNPAICALRGRTGLGVPTLA